MYAHHPRLKTLALIVRLPRKGSSRWSCSCFIREDYTAADRDHLAQATREVPEPIFAAIMIMSARVPRINARCR